VSLRFAVTDEPAAAGSLFSHVSSCVERDFSKVELQSLRAHIYAALASGRRGALGEQ